jgi:hypothetical protein
MGIMTTTQEGGGSRIMDFRDEMKTSVRVPYALRRIPEGSFRSLVPCSNPPQPGDITLARVERIGKTTRLELPNGRLCSLHEGDLIAAVFGNRYATLQFEAYARADGERCDLLGVGGLCGLVESKHADVPQPSKLRLLGFLGDADGRPLRLRQFGLEPAPVADRPRLRVIGVCGTSMDAGKTYTAVSIIKGLCRQGHRVAGVKLTGTATGKDTWKMGDAGAFPALDFVDGGLPSTYLCDVDELLNLYDLFLAHAASEGATSMVVEIADGLLQNETAALLQNSRFSQTVQSWVFAAGDPLAAAGGVRVLRSWGIRPVAISGVVSMSPLAVKEAQAATGLPCVTAADLKHGKLNARLLEPPAPVSTTSAATEDMYQCSE